MQCYRLRSVVLAAAVGLFASGPAPAHESDEVQLEGLDARLARAPEEPELLLARAAVLRDLGRYEAARKDCVAARRYLPEPVEADLELARVWIDAGSGERALPLLRRYLDCRPGSASAWEELARALTRLELHHEAADAYRGTIERLGAPRVELYLDLARARLLAGEPEAALAALDDGLARLGFVITLEMAAVDMELRRGAPDAALARIDEILRRVPRGEAWQCRRAELLLGLGRREEARRAFLQARAALHAVPPARRQAPRLTRLAATIDARLAQLDREESP